MSGVTNADVAAAPAADDLRTQVRRSGRRRQYLMLLLMAPSVVFVAIFFAWPIALFLFRSVDNPEVFYGLPETRAALQSWDGKGLPSERAFAALAKDLAPLKGTPELAVLARRLNYNVPGFRSLLIRTARQLPAAVDRPYTELLTAIDRRWAESEFWGAIKNESGRLTDFYVLTALDLRRAPDGSVTKVPDNVAVFTDLFIRTVHISMAVAVLCLLFGFPVAVVMANATPRTANLLLMLVLIPFWTSLLVRSTAWVILLQNQGLANQLLIWFGAIDEPIQLVFNRIGLYIAMVHVLLPFMILPLYSVLKGMPPDFMRAAASLGARPLQRFTRVYVPLALPGIVAGTSLVFILSLGYYITPALVGGPGDQMIGYFIAYFTNSAVNWGMASALGSILLLIVVLLYLAIARFANLSRVRFA